MFEHDYPDVLGTITGGRRVEMQSLQCAAGVYPVASAVGQPFELLVVLQSTIDRSQEVVLGVRLPRKNSQNQRLSFMLPQRTFKLNLGPAEVGVMHIPLSAQPPTPPDTGYPLILRVEAHPPKESESIRQPGAGRPPSALSVSPFRLEVLREVAFSKEGAADQLRCRFDVIPGYVKAGMSRPEPKYEALWTASDFEMEQDRIQESISTAEQIASTMSRSAIFHHLEEATQDRFAAAGMPLHPGEALFIAKAMTYILEDAYQYERDFDLYDARWFQWLCSLLVREEDTVEEDLGRLAAGDLYLGALYDAVWVTLPMVQTATGKRYGTRQEHRLYADRVVQAVQGNETIDLSHAYLPLIMAGVLLNIRIALRYENLWQNLDLLEEAVRGRGRLTGAQNNEIFVAVGNLIDGARDLLRRSRVPRE